MIVGAGELLSIGVAFVLNKAIPALWKGHTAARQEQLKDARNLCEKHGDCEAQKLHAMQGLKPVIRLQPVELIGPPEPEEVKK